MTYEEWVRHIFDPPILDGDEWYRDEEELVLPETQMISFVTKIFSSCATDLQSYSNEQIALGVNYLMNPAFSNYSSLVSDKSIDMSERRDFILSILELYRGCFEKRCDKVLCHTGLETSRLNGTCYMLWDIQPMGQLIYAKRKKDLARAIREVFEGILELKNVACLESALHGLGHAKLMSSEDTQIGEIIENFLKKRGRGLPAELINYAVVARQGRVQ